MHVPGEPGLWILLFGDLTVFALLFGVYLHGRADAPARSVVAQQELDQALGAINTLLLLTGSLLVVVGVQALKAQAERIAVRMFAGALLCAAGFLVTKYIEWSHHLADGLTPAAGDFWMFYYALTGLHLFHLIIGTVALTYLLTQARRRQPLTRMRLVFVEGAACFWHVVDLIWLVLFPLLYLVK